LHSATHESDDWAYEKISEEIESGNRDKATWTRAFANTGGDDKQTTALYIKLRVEKLKVIVEAAKISAAAKKIEEATLPKSEVPAVDQAANQSNTVTPITIGVAMGALILLFVVFGAKLSGALGPTPTPAPVGSGTASAPSIPTPVIPQGSRQLILLFDDKSWVEIRDASKSVLLVGEFTNGERQVAVGKPPFHLWVGRASAVRLFDGDREIDLKQHTSGEVARLIVE
jgi:hypothetical protein